MKLIVPAELAVCLIVAALIPWPWGVVAAAGCLLIPPAVMVVLLRTMTVHSRRPLPPRETLRVGSMRIWPPGAPVPGKTAPAVSTGRPPGASE